MKQLQSLLEKFNLIHQVFTFVKMIVAIQLPWVQHYWLLLDALIIAINILFNMEVEVVGLGDGFEIFDEFDSKFFILQKNIGRKSLR
jgi:hypothetical protein